MDEDIVIPIAFFVTTIVLGLGIPLVRAHIRRAERDPLQPSVPNEVAARLERMEHAIETIAVEVERISEGQRFASRLLAERVVANGAAGAPGHPAGAAPSRAPAPAGEHPQ
jgi:hypothetical protein